MHDLRAGKEELQGRLAGIAQRLPQATSDQAAEHLHAEREHIQEELEGLEAELQRAENRDRLERKIHELERQRQALREELNR